MAQAGYIAVEINGMPPYSAKEAVNEIWQRPGDISRALDALLENADYSTRVIKVLLEAVTNQTDYVTETNDRIGQ